MRSSLRLGRIAGIEIGIHYTWLLAFFLITWSLAHRDALDKLLGEKELVIIPGATHLFEEPGALEEVARLAANWFLSHLIRTI